MNTWAAYAEGVGAEGGEWEVRDDDQRCLMGCGTHLQNSIQLLTWNIINYTTVYVGLQDLRTAPPLLNPSFFCNFWSVIEVAKQLCIYPTEEPVQ